jgi:hypothetical protein
MNHILEAREASHAEQLGNRPSARQNCLVREVGPAGDLEGDQVAAPDPGQAAEQKVRTVHC